MPPKATTFASCLVPTSGLSGGGVGLISPAAIFFKSVGTSFSKGDSLAFTENNSIETHDNRLHNWKCISYVSWVTDPCTLIEAQGK